MLQVRQLNHVAIHVADVECSVRFYAEVLQLQSLPRPAFSFPGAWFRLGDDQELHLIGDEQYRAVMQHRGNHFALLVDDIAPWEAHLQRVGAKFLPRKIRPDGAYQIFLADPDGHYIELCTLPKAAQAGQP